MVTPLRRSLYIYAYRKHAAVINLKSGQVIKGLITRAGRLRYKGLTEDGKEVEFGVADIKSHKRMPEKRTSKGHSEFISHHEGREVVLTLHIPGGEEKITGVIGRAGKRGRARPYTTIEYKDSKNKQVIRQFLSRDIKDIKLAKDLRDAKPEQALNVLLDSLPSSKQAKARREIKKLVSLYAPKPDAEVDTKQKETTWARPFAVWEFRETIQKKIGHEVDARYVTHLLNSLTRAGQLHKRSILSPRPHTSGGIISEAGHRIFYSADPRAIEAMEKHYDNPEEQLKLALRRTFQASFGKRNEKSYLKPEWINKTVLQRLKKGTTQFHLKTELIDGYRADLLKHMASLFQEGKAQRASKYSSESARLNFFTHHRLVGALRPLVAGSEVWKGMDLLYTEKGANPNPQSFPQNPEVSWYCLNTPDSIESMQKKMRGVDNEYKQQKKEEKRLAAKVREDAKDSRRYKKDRRIKL
ncbi:hypothetical protein ACFLQ2_00420 [archaeon]